MYANIGIGILVKKGGHKITYFWAVVHFWKKNLNYQKHYGVEMRHGVWLTLSALYCHDAGNGAVDDVDDTDGKRQELQNLYEQHSQYQYIIDSW